MDPMIERIRSVMKTEPLGRYQVHGVRFLERMGGNALLADDRGLGKTYQTISYLALHPELANILIICPSIAKYVWHRQLWQHARMRSSVIEGRTPHPLKHNIQIINYDLLHYWIEWFSNQEIHQVIADESHRCNNLGTKRTSSIRQIVQKCGKFIALSGTPIKNRPIEFFSTLNLIAPQEFNSIREYAYAYCGPKRVRGEMKFTGASYLPELHERVKPYMLRRTKTEVLKYLPTKNRQIIPIKINNMKQYEKARDDFISWLLQQHGLKAVERAERATKLVQTNHLKRLAAEGKLIAIKQWIEEFMEDNPDEKFVGFSIHRHMTNTLCNYFKGAIKIDGSMSAFQKQAAADEFQNGPKKLLFGNIDAAGESIDLTAAWNVGFFEFGWNPAVHDQAGDRCLRHGQKSDKMNEYWFGGIDTIDEDIIDMLQSKNDIIGQVIDGREEDHVLNQVIDRMLLKHGKST